jgi:hypothetical protein
MTVFNETDPISKPRKRFRSEKLEEGLRAIPGTLI